MKRKIDVEALVQWTFCEELPKRRLQVGDGSEFSYGVGSWSEEMAPIDDSRMGSQRYAYVGVPHADAETVAGVVAGLPTKVAFTGELREFLMPDLLSITPKADLLAGRLFNERALVEAFAKMRGRPKWNIGEPAPAMILSANLRDPVVIGRCHGKNRYAPGAVCPLQWKPDVEAIAYARAKYAIWRVALTRVAANANVLTLRDHVAVAPAAAVAPWIIADGVPRILRSVVPPAPANDRGRKRRRRAAA